MSATEEIAAFAARLVVDEGMEYAAAKRKAARDLGARAELPSNEEVEDAVREHIEIFCADTQPAELQAMREAALLWMQRLAEFRPHLSGAVWRGTATRLSTVHLDLYCDDDKAVERRVQVLRKRGSDALVTGNLRSGDKVIVTAIARLFSGAPIVVGEATPTPTPAASGTGTGAP